MRREKKSSVSLSKSIKLKQAVANSNFLRRKCYALITHPLFEMFIVFCILLNTISLCFDTYPCIIY